MRGCGSGGQGCLNFFGVLEVSLEERRRAGEGTPEFGIFGVGDEDGRDSINHGLMIAHFVIDVGLIEGGSGEGFEVGGGFGGLLLERGGGVAVGGGDVELGAEVADGLLQGGVVGDHLLGELADLRVVGFGEGELAVGDVDVVGGDDDADDLRIGGRLGAGVGGQEESGSR